MTTTTRSTRPRKPRGSRYDRVRSVRVCDEVWNAARSRAAASDYTMSYVIFTMIQAYAQGSIDIHDLPKVELTHSDVPTQA